MRHLTTRSAMYVACCFTALIWSGAGSALPTVIGFDEALRRAQSVAPMLAARRAQTIAAQAEGARASALPDPKLTVGLDNLPVTGTNAFELRAEEMTMKRVGVMQEFPARAKRGARQAIADRLTDEALAMTVAESLSVRRSTAQAWIGLWAVKREVFELQGLREQSALAVRVASARLSGGSGTAVDALATQAAALELDNRIEEAKASVEAARATLARWLDVKPTGLGIFGEPPDLAVLPTGESALLSSIDRQGPLLPWLSREAVAEAELSLASAQKRPDWSVAASYGQRDSNRSDMLMVEFSIDLPLFTANRQDQGIAAKRAELDAVVASREDARRAQIEDVHRMLAEWNGLKSQVARRATQMLPLARDRSQTAVAGYGGGEQLQPWLEARRDEIELQINQARQLGQLGRAWAALAYLLPTDEVSP